MAGGNAEPVDQFLAERSDLRDLLEVLLEDAETAGTNPLPPPTPGPVGHPEQIGGYRILERLGEGGMGTVYLAEQDEPVRRQVALKLLKLGMDTRQVLARFEAERQALAMMEHDSIAKVYDAGTSDRGQPFFAMELVRGAPITEHCDRHQLSMTARLRLFQQVCVAVQHAHQKGMIHRDLKPSNVLVTELQGKAVPKVIDFGIAKAIDQSTDRATLLTEEGQVIGTPEYMSPEQTDATNGDIDTRSDVYSLGVILYELMVSELPLSITELRRMGLPEIGRRIREEDPQKPSARLAALGSSLPRVAQDRQTSATRLQRRLRGDLDWIIMKALEKHRDRRYASPSDLAADLERHLNDQPVEASPPKTSYRLAKFVRRHRGRVVAGALLLVTLIAGAVGSAMFAIDADRQRGRAETKIGEFNLLSGVVELRNSIAAERDLYPAWPRVASAMREWLAARADPLLSSRDELDEALSVLRQRALPPTQAEQETDRLQHPRFAEFERIERHLGVLRLAEQVSAGTAEAPTFKPNPKGLPAEPRTLTHLGSGLIDFKKGNFGREAEGVALLELALTMARSEYERLIIEATVPYGLMKIGRDEEARRRMRALRDGASAKKRALYEKYLVQIEKFITGRPKRIAELETELAVRDRPWRWRFADEAERFLHDALTTLREEIDGFEATQVAAVRSRLAEAESVEKRSIDAHQARWDKACREIASSHGIELKPQIGLVPIGKNPVTGLWEFVHLLSAAKDQPIPEHQKDGSVRVTGETGIIFVLIPGATFQMGAQRDKTKPRYDPRAQTDEFVHEATVGTYFIARHELTQGQWIRLSGEKNPSFYPSGVIYEGMKTKVTLAHPVERLTWNQCDRLTRHCGLQLPTEAQWEYACSAGTTTPWWSGADVQDLKAHGNVRDAKGFKAVPTRGFAEDYDDGHAIHAPVGTFTPNSFGMYDMHGNVWEYCCDVFDLRSTAAEDIGEFRSIRGGTYAEPAVHARTTNRHSDRRDRKSVVMGMRAVRALDASR